MASIFFVITIGLVFGLVAALMAFLITYGEYSRHFMAKSRALKISLETAFVMLAVFIIIAIITGFVLSRG
jgi:hypothetical protein